MDKDAKISHNIRKPSSSILIQAMHLFKIIAQQERPENPSAISKLSWCPLLQSQSQGGTQAVETLSESPGLPWCRPNVVAPVHKHFEGTSAFGVAPKVGWLRKIWIQFMKELMSSVCEIRLHGNVLLQKQEQTRRILISGCNVLDRVKSSPWAKLMPNLVLFQRQVWH